MKSWLEPIWEPGRFLRAAQRDERPDDRVGLALLLEFQTRLYGALAAERGWPLVGESVTPKTAGARLLGAVGLHLVGNPQAKDEYGALLSSRSAGMATTATLLLNLLYRDEGRRDDAIGLLREREERASSPMERVLMGLHVGVRMAEGANWERAEAQTDDALAFAARHSRERWMRELIVIGEHNLFQYRWKQRRFEKDPLNLPDGSDLSALLRGDVLTARGLTRYLEGQFDRGLGDPYVRTVHFAPQDATEQKLQAAALRSLLLADWEGAKRDGKSLGRYQIVTRLGIDRHVPSGAITLLRQSGDDKGVRAAARTVARMGPLGPLQQATASVLDDTAWLAEPTSALVLLSEGADILSQAAASSAVERLTQSADIVREHWHEATRALAELARVAGSSTQRRLAQFARENVEGEGHAGLVQGLAKVVDTVRWDEVPQAERRRWLHLIDENLGRPSDLQIVAATALVALGRADRVEIDRILRSAFEERPNLELVALMQDALGVVPEWARDQSEAITVTALQATRDDAGRGRYGFGSLDVGALAIALLKARPRRLLSGTACSTCFLTQRSVSARRCARSTCSPREPFQCQVVFAKPFEER